MAKRIREIEEMISRGPFTDDWDRFRKRRFRNGSKDKFDFHPLGRLLSSRFQNEWYPRNMYIEGSEEYFHHLKTYGEHKNFGYKDFIPLFKAEKFDPEVWAKLIKDSGARYLVQVAEHHDGFQMYESAISEWNAKKMGPKRDLLFEIREECRKAGLKFGASSHRAEHWFFFYNGRKFASDIGEDLKKGDFYWPSEPERDHFDFTSAPEPSREFLEDWLERVTEIIDRFSPEILYFDWWVQHRSFKPFLKKAAAYYYNHAVHCNHDAVICYKHDAFGYGTGVIHIERGGFRELRHFPWQTETSIANNSWAYTQDLDYKSVEELLTLLIDVVSKNGNLLLNICPKADGTIPDYEIKALSEVGAWLKANGKRSMEPNPSWSSRRADGNRRRDVERKGNPLHEQDFRFTANNGAVYVLVLNRGAQRASKSEL